MNKRTVMTLSVAVLTACLSLTASADGLLGKHYMGAQFFSQNWGDSATDSLLGRSNGGQLLGNYNLAENWDITFSYSGLSDSYDTMISTNSVHMDVERHETMAGLNYLFPSEFSVTPYIGGMIGAVYTKDGDSSETDTAYSAELGAEWDMCEHAFLTLAATYGYVDTNVSGNDGSYGIKALTGIKVIDHLMLVGGASYTIEDEDARVNIGLLIVQ